ncbi:MAG TPA: helix-turn-helix domain-containing protein [Nitrososphaerales archaeon]|nr:helix-turn-helix domain-containing protein [Nitrososphaerales archaeon]
MAPKVTRSYKDDIKRRILIAAFKEFSARGYHRANLDRVARAVGIARGTIYLYFDSKRQLFEALSAFQLANLKTLLERHDWTGEDVAATARSFFRELRRGLPENSERMAVEMLAESSRNKELKRQRLLESRQMQDIISAVIQEQVGESRRRKRTDESADSRALREMALGSIALYNGLSSLRVLGYETREIEEAWSRTISLIAEGWKKDMRERTGEKAPASAPSASLE